MTMRRSRTPKPKRRKTTAEAASRSSAADLQKRLDRRTRELAKTRKLLRETLQQQSATSEVLQVINSSAVELASVFDAMLKRAMRLCEAAFGGLWVFDGGRYVARALCGVPPAYASYLHDMNLVPGPHTGPYRFLQGERSAIQNVDLAAEEPYRTGDPQRRALVDLGGARTALQVPLARDDLILGVITVYRQEVRPFSEQQVTLLQNFAQQAVIAIENVRLFNETKEALERQTATADILKVIASSPSDVQPVFEAIATSAKWIIGGFSTSVFRFVDGVAHLAAYTPTNPAADQILKGTFPRPVAEFHPFALAQAGELVQVTDTEAHPDARMKEVARARGFRSVLNAPLMSKGTPIGVITATRKEPGSFPEHHVRLLRTFADQAVIAIENARLFNELQERTRDLSEALTYQTGSSNILRVISSSPTNVEPVLQAIVESACQLCDAYDAVVRLKDGDELTFSAHHGPIPINRDKWLINRNWTAGRAVMDKKPVHVHDMLSAEGNEFWEAQEKARYQGHRTILSVPLLQEGESVGAIVLRRTEVHPFSDKQIALLQTFAEQAVIAIGNVRLFEEVQARTRDLAEALEQQTATSEVLEVISSSPGDLQPVFRSMLNNALRICEAKFGQLLLFDGKGFLAGELHSTPAAYAELFKRGPLVPGPNTGLGRLIASKTVIHIPDVTSGSLYAERDPLRIATVEILQARTLVAVPMLKDTELVGAIVIYRREVRPFSDRQIELVTNFAAQAVIAIENTRLLKELHERTDDLTESLQQQTATGDVLKVIASSPTNVEPALQAIVESACAFCGAYDAAVVLKVGDDLHFSAHHGPIRPGQQPRPINRQWVTGRSVVDKMPVQVSDFQAPEAVEFPEGQRQSREQGMRCTLSVPLMREGEAIGALVLRRLEPVAFSDKQVALLQTFADQAVIAIGNVRLFEEVQAKTRDLSESLQQQTATADVLKVISRSAFDLQAVLDTLVESAGKLCNTTMTNIWLRDGDVLRSQAQIGLSEGFSEFLRTHPTTRDRGKFVGRAFLTGELVHLPDVLADPEYTFFESPKIGQFRSALGVPLIRKGEVEGVFALAKPEPGGFTDREIELVRTFADQALIAIENVRLFDEVQAKTRDLSEALTHQTGSANILRVIASSPTDVGPVLKAIVESACELCEAYDAVLVLKQDGELRVGAHHGQVPLNRTKWPNDRSTVSGRSIADRAPVHVHDVILERAEFPIAEEMSRRDGGRSVLGVPMLSDGESIGAIVLRRTDVQPFSNKQITLLQTFADQAVIAIGNVRLFEQVQERTRDLSLSLDNLRTAQDRLIQTEKLASLGQLTAGIAHEIKNPLNFVNNFAALSAELTDELKDALGPVALDDEVRKEIDELTGLLKDNLEKVVQHGKRADSIVKNMLLHSRAGSGERRFVDINTLVEESLNLAYHGARAEKPDFGISFRRDLDADAGAAEVYPQEVTRALLNLISNGFYAATKRKSQTDDQTYEPVLSATTRSLGNQVEIRIRDNGIGIPSEVKEKIFNPFFTTKPAGEGTGLGLSMTHDIIVKQHGGSVTVETEPDVFTEFIITLPRGGIA
jgi:GAF domain-containing protein